MFDHSLRKVKEELLEHLAKPFRSIHPNAITLIGFSCVVASSWQVYLGEYRLGLVFWTFYMFADGIDGTVARMTKQQSDFGGFLDKNLDAIGFSIVLLAFGLVMNDYWLFVCIAAILAMFYINIGMLFMLSAVLEKRAVGNKKLTTVQMPKSLVEGFESFLFYTLFFVFPGFIHELILVFTCLMALTVVHRFWWAWRNL